MNPQSEIIANAEKLGWELVDSGITWWQHFMCFKTPSGEEIVIGIVRDKS